jgi:regulator of sirC expression with transglutaminase-like and TPR domain
MEPTPRERFAALARMPDERIDVAEGALLVAAEACPGLVVERHLAELDALAREAAPAVQGKAGAREQVNALLAFVAAQGFHGNQDDYYDPRNSYLNDVLARRTGIPITLALVYLELGRRLGMPLAGVSFPGHFLVKHADARSGDGAGALAIVVDPFSGATLSDDDVRERFKLAMGPESRFEPRWLRPATPREILVRLLGNLKQIHVQREELERALACCDRILLLAPDAPLELRDRGIVHQRLECFGAAVGDLERFLELSPRDPSADAIRETLPNLRSQARRVS